MISSEGEYESVRDVGERLRSILESSRETRRHQMLIEKLKKLLKKCNDESRFASELKTALRYCLVYPDKSAVDSVLQFVAKFAIALYSVESQDRGPDADTINENCTVPNEILKFVFKTHGAPLVDVRLRCVQLLNKVLSGLPESATISNGMWEKLKETVLLRIQDKSPAVRAQAVLVGRRLQDPKNPQCDIIKAFIFHLNDPSSLVRRSVVSSVAFNKCTIGHVLARTRDVAENVRRNAYIVFSKVRVVNLTIKYRLTILERGLTDRSASVRNCVQSVLLVNWLENFNNDVLMFLHGLDVVNCPEVTLKIAENVCKTLPIDDVIKLLPLDADTRLIPAEEITPEMALLWRAAAHHLWREKREEELERVLPNITVFCDFIRSFYPLDKERKNANASNDEKWREVKEKESFKHLLQLIKVFDLSDEMGRSKLKRLILDMLISSRIDNGIVESLIELLAPVSAGREAFLQEVTEIISELRKPLVEDVHVPLHKKLETEMHVSNLKMALNELRERELSAVVAKDYAGAESIAEQIDRVECELRAVSDQECNVLQEVREEKSDPVTLCKCLTILTEMIRWSKVASLTPTLRNIKDDFLSQCLTSRDLVTQSLAVRALGQFCVLDLALAKENLLRFLLMLSESGDDEINGPVLKSIFDILLFHGVDPFKNLCDESAGGGDGKSADDDDLFDENEELEAARGADDDDDDDDDSSKPVLILAELLNCKNNDLLKSVGFEGLCKLLLSGVVRSTSLLQRIIVRGFSPITDNDAEDYIRQVFMVFFPAFASTAPRSQEMIAGAFVPVVRELARAPLGTPAADINPKDVASFLIEHTKPRGACEEAKSKTLHVHNSLAVSICREILRENCDCSESGILAVYVKSLARLKLSLDDESVADELRALVDRIQKELRDKNLARYVRELRRRLEETGDSTVENTLSAAVVGSPARERVSTRKRASPTAARHGATRKKISKTLTATREVSSSSSDVESPVECAKSRDFVPESPEIE